MKKEVINWERMKKTLPYIKTKWKKINITKDIQFKTKQANYSLHIYTKWQNNHKDIIFNVILHLKYKHFHKDLKMKMTKKRTLLKTVA